MNLLRDKVNLLLPIPQTLLRPEHRGIRLHDLLHLQSDVGGWVTAVRVPGLVKIGNRRGAGVFGQIAVGCARFEGIFNVKSSGTAENDNVEQGVCAETVSAMHGHAGGFAGSVKTRNDNVLPILEHHIGIGTVFNDFRII